MERTPVTDPALRHGGAEPAWTQLPQLNSTRAGTEILFATDEWFAVAGNLNKEDPAVFDPNAFDDEGKLMDGWETRRKRTAGHDWCLMKLGLEGVIKGVEADTSFFTGNQVPRISIQAANLSSPLPLPPWNAKPRKGTKASNEEVDAAVACGTDKWETIVPMSILKPGYFDTCRHFFTVEKEHEKRYTHIRVNYWPDGGVARLRVFGEVQKDWSKVPSGLVDLAATSHGGLGLMASNAHYGRPQNLLGAGRGVNMGDGWETARNPNRPPEFKVDASGMMELPGNDWCIIQLGVPGKIEKIEIDTIHFKGNYPESCLLEACTSKVKGGAFDHIHEHWSDLMPRTRLSANAIHTFDASSGVIPSTSAVTHVRLTIYPDGGISRVRLWGKPEQKARL